MLRAPQPRSRLYTSLASYGRGLRAILGDRDTGAVPGLERSLNELFPDHQAIAVPMCRVGIYLTIKHLIKPGQKVILSPYTIADVVNMVLCAGGVPVFVDIEPGGSCNIDAELVVARIKADADVGAVLVTHFYGLVCNIDPIIETCRQKNIPVVEDAAQAFGARLGSHRAGTIGHAGIFSFGLVKNVTGFLGGAVLTRDTELARKIRDDLASMPSIPASILLQKMAKGAGFDTATFQPVFSTSVYWLFRYAYLHGIKLFSNQLATDSNPVRYDRFPAAYSYHMSNTQAAIIRSHLGRLEQDTAERIAKAQLYAAGLEGTPGLILPPLRTDGSHIYLYYPIQCADRDGLAKALTRDMRDVQVSHHRNCAELACFSAIGANCPNAHRAAHDVIYLPTYPGYRDEEVQANIAMIRAHLGARKQ